MLLAAIASILALIITIIDRKKGSERTSSVKQIRSDTTNFEKEINKKDNYSLPTLDTSFQLSSDKRLYFTNRNIVLVKNSSTNINDTLLNLPLSKVHEFEIIKSYNVLSIHFNNDIDKISIGCDNSLRNGTFISFLEELSNKAITLKVQVHNRNVKMIFARIIFTIGIICLISAFSYFLEFKGFALAMVSVVLMVIGGMNWSPIVDF